MSVATSTPLTRPGTPLPGAVVDAVLDTHETESARRPDVTRWVALVVEIDGETFVRAVPHAAGRRAVAELPVPGALAMFDRVPDGGLVVVMFSGAAFRVARLRVVPMSARGAA